MSDNILSEVTRCQKELVRKRKQDWKKVVQIGILGYIQYYLLKTAFNFFEFLIGKTHRTV